MNNMSADALKTAINSVYGLSSRYYYYAVTGTKGYRWREAEQKTTSKKAMALNSIKRVIFNDPATIVLWADGTKTVVKCAKDERFDPEKGLAMAIAKKALGNEGWYYDIFKAYLPKDGDEK